MQCLLLTSICCSWIEVRLKACMVWVPKASMHSSIVVGGRISARQLVQLCAQEPTLHTD